MSKVVVPADSGPLVEHPARPRTLLVVEDEPLIRLTTVEFLRDQGYRVVEAASGEEALTALRALTVDLVISDVRMPGTVDGVSLANWIAENRAGLKVILVSAHPPPLDRHITSVVWPAVTKPYQLAELAARVSAALGPNTSP